MVCIIMKEELGSLVVSPLVYWYFSNIQCTLYYSDGQFC